MNDDLPNDAQFPTSFKAIEFQSGVIIECIVPEAVR